MRHVFPFFVAAGMEPGAEQYVRLAADPTLEDVSGMYFVKGKTNDDASSPLAREPAVQKHIDEVAETWAGPFLRRRPRSVDRSISASP